MRKIDKLVFQVMQSFIIPDEKEIILSPSNFAKVVTMNENLKGFGYTLKPQDMIRLAKIDSFAENKLLLDKKLKRIQPEIPTKPMYPDFPLQVLRMDEVALLFDQIMHYMSFAINESIPETKDMKAWLPEVEETEKRKPDKTLLNAKVVGLVTIEDVKKHVEHLLVKRERWTNNEMQLVLEVFPIMSNCKYLIGFKENLTKMILQSFKEEKSPKDIEKLIIGLSQNPNDVLDILEQVLVSM